MFCRNCGTRIPDNTVRYCPTCGDAFSLPGKKGPSTVEKIFWVAASIAVIWALGYLLTRTSPVRPPESQGGTPVNTTPAVQTVQQPAGTDPSVSAPGLPGGNTSVSPRMMAAESLNNEIHSALTDTQVALDLKYLDAVKKYRVTVVVRFEGDDESQMLDVASRFFSACYGNADHPVEIASILFRNSNGADVLSIGIGHRKAGALPISTWQQFKGEGASLHNWVLERSSSSPSSLGDVCYYRYNP